MMSRRKFKVWVNSLVNEGYDLSDYTWDELYEEYLELREVTDPKLRRNIAMNRVLDKDLNDRGGVLGQLNRVRISMFGTGAENNRINSAERNAWTRARQAGAASAGKYYSTSDGKEYANYNDALAAHNSRVRQAALKDDPGGKTGGGEPRPQPASANPSPTSQASSPSTQSSSSSSTTPPSQNPNTLNVKSGKGGAVTAGTKYSATFGNKAADVTYTKGQDNKIVKTIYDKATGNKAKEETLTNSFYYWVDELHEQGYDLSNYTWEGLFEYYCDEVLSEADSSSSQDAAWNTQAARARNYRYSLMPGGSSSAPNNDSTSTSAPSTKPAQTILASRSGVQGTMTKGDPESWKAKDGGWNKAETNRFVRVGSQNYSQQSQAARATGATQATKDIARDTGSAVWRASNPTAVASETQRAASNNPLMQKTFGYQRGDQAWNRQAQTVRDVRSSSVPGASMPTSSSSQTTTTTTPQTSMRTLSAADQKANLGQPRRLQTSFDFGKSNYITEDVNYLYHSIYEGSRIDQDADNDNDGADVMIARMIASGMSKEEAIRRTRNKPYNKKGKKTDEELKEFAALVPLVARAAAPLAGRLIGGAVARGVAGNAAQGGLRSGLGRLAGNLAGNKVRRKLETMGQQDDSDEESKDESLTYEILNHLIENGYADTPEQAAAMFENFSEDYQYAIIEHLQSF